MLFCEIADQTVSINSALQWLRTSPGRFSSEPILAAPTRTSVWFPFQSHVSPRRSTDIWQSSQFHSLLTSCLPSSLEDTLPKVHVFFVPHNPSAVLPAPLPLRLCYEQSYCLGHIIQDMSSSPKKVIDVSPLLTPNLKSCLPSTFPMEHCITVLVQPHRMWWTGWIQQQMCLLQMCRLEVEDHSSGKVGFSQEFYACFTDQLCLHLTMLAVCLRNH